MSARYFINDFYRGEMYITLGVDHYIYINCSARYSVHKYDWRTYFRKDWCQKHIHEVDETEFWVTFGLFKHTSDTAIDCWTVAQKALACVRQAPASLVTSIELCSFGTDAKNAFDADGRIF